MAERDLTRHWALKDVAADITNELTVALNIEWGFLAGEPRPDVTMITVWEALERAGAHENLRALAESIVKALATDIRSDWGDVRSPANRSVALDVVLRHLKAARRKRLL